MRSLALKKETLAELTSEQLFGVVGASYKTKYDCTESYQACVPLPSREFCLAPTPLCPTTPATPLV